MKNIKAEAVKQKHRSRFLWSLILVVGVTAGLFMQGQTQAQSESESQVSNVLPLEDLQLFAEVFGRIKREYVDEVDDAVLLRYAIKGMLTGLDPHSVFLEPEDFAEIKISTEGKFGGLGIEVTSEDGLIKVVTAIDGTPAFDGGVKSGDTILMIDDVSLQGMRLNEATDKMRGDLGTKIKLTIFRESINDRLDIELVRSLITMNSVRGEILEDGFGYVKISSFQSGTAQSLRSKIKQLNKLSEGGLNGFVLDLRNNPGGILMGAVQVSDMFIVEGEIVSTRGRGATSGQSFKANANDVINDAPMVVLVNGGSASSSEIVAGALQDHQRAIIMGTKTFGKGSVQSVIPMSNGSALKLTTARYYTPLNQSIQAKGIIPDVMVEQAGFSTASSMNGGSRTKRDAKAGDKVAKDKQINEADLVGHLENTESVDEVDELEIQLLERLKKDRQLREALNMLKGMSLVKRSTRATGG